MVDRSRTTHVLLTEGGEWIAWVNGYPKVSPATVHAIKFEDGSIWDTANGWRPEARVYVPLLDTDLIDG